MKRPFAQKRPLASNHDIRAFLGFVDDEIVMILSDAKATRCELRAALDELNGDDYGTHKRLRESNGKISYLYEMLRQRWYPHAASARTF